eukprot:4015498-Prymnesium_polylepis.2
MLRLWKAPGGASSYVRTLPSWSRVCRGAARRAMWAVSPSGELSAAFGGRAGSKLRGLHPEVLVVLRDHPHRLLDSIARKVAQ